MQGPLQFDGCNFCMQSGFYQQALTQWCTACAGSFPEVFPPSSPSRNDGSPKIQEAVTPDIKRLTRSALKKAASASVQKVRPRAPLNPQDFCSHSHQPDYAPTYRSGCERVWAQVVQLDVLSRAVTARKPFSWRQCWPFSATQTERMLT